MDRTDGIARKDAAHLFRGAVQEHHRLATEPADKKRLDASRLGVIKYGPEADSPEVTPQRAANKRQGLVALGLDHRKTVFRQNSDVGFQHEDPLARIEADSQRTSVAPNTERRAACEIVGTRCL